MAQITIEEINSFFNSLSTEEKTKVLSGLASGKLPKDIIPKQWQDNTTWQKEFTLALGQAIQQNPEYVKDILREQASDRFVKKYKPALNLILQGADIFTSLGQINQSNKALAKLAQPSIPQSPGIDPALNNEIFKAQQGTFDQTRALAPARQGINDAYAAQENVNRQLSGGQAGEYGARTQAAYNDRLRAAGQLPMLADNIKAREQQRLDNLINTRGQLAQQDFGNRLNSTGLALDQYNRNLASAGALGAQGRSNLRNVFQTLPENLTRYVGGFTGDPAKDPYGYGQHTEAQVAAHILKNNSGMSDARARFMNHPAYTNQYFNNN